MNKNHTQQSTLQAELFSSFGTKPNQTGAQVFPPTLPSIKGNGIHTSDLPVALSSSGSKMQNGKEARILIVEDFPILAEGISHILNNEEGFSVHKAGKGGELNAISEIQPDAVVLNVTYLNRIELLRTIAAEYPGLPILAHAIYDDLVYGERALVAGATGYISKSESAGKLVEALQKVLLGQLAVPDALLEKMMRLSLRGKSIEGNSPDRLLSPRELSVFWQIGRGKGTREIAEEMGLSIKTIETHRAHIKEKLGVGTAPELVRAAVHWVAQQIKPLAEE